MSKNSKNSLKEINEFFAAEPDTEEKAWIIIDEFYHYISKYMQDNNISRADLSRRLDKSRAAVSQMFNKTPNLTIKKMVEIADAIGINLSIVPREIALKSRQPHYNSLHETVTVQISLEKNIKERVNEKERIDIHGDENMIITVNDIQYSTNQFGVS